MTWQQCQSLAARTLRAAGIRYGKNTNGRRAQFGEIMAEEHGPGWKEAAKSNARVARARLELERSEAEARLRDSADALLVDGEEEEDELF